MKKTSFLLLLLLPVAQIYGQVEVTVHNNKSQNKGLFISETPSIVEDTFRVLSIQSLNKKEHSCEDSKWNETYIIHIENEDGIFVLLSPSTTGITYKNEIKVSDSCFLKIKPYNNHDYYPKHGIFDSFFIHEVCYKLDYGRLWFQNIYTTENLDGLYLVTDSKNKPGKGYGKSFYKQLKVDNILKTTFSDTIIRKPEDLSFNEEGLVVWQKISYLPNERFHHYEDVYSGRVFGPISLRTNDFPIGEKGRKDLIYHNCFASLFILAKTCTYMESNNAGHNELYYAFYYHDMIFVDGYVENGLETGKWKFYYVDKLIIEAEFENGQLNGLCNFYDLDGNLIRSTKFINNKNVDELPNIQPSGQWSKRNPRKWEWIELKRFKE